MVFLLTAIFLLRADHIYSTSIILNGINHRNHNDIRPIFNGQINLLIGIDIKWIDSTDYFSSKFNCFNLRTSFNL